MIRCICNHCTNRFVCWTSRKNELPSDVFHKIHESIGAASVCWSDVKQAGIFDANKASEVARLLCEYINERVKEWK